MSATDTNTGFRLKNFGSNFDYNDQHECSQCADAGVEHKVTYTRPVAGMRVCSGCQFQDGPWTDADSSPYNGY